jgi:hypothetical protein
MKNAFRTNSGRLTVYALQCGYIYRAIVDGGPTIDMFLENAEMHIYSVIAFSKEGRKFWEQFESKAEAEKFYAAECRKICATNIWE